MASKNRKSLIPTIKTHEGAPAKRITPLQQLRRSLLSCLLWENEFYEDGVSIAERIRYYAENCEFHEVHDLAVEARSKHGLRHAPLILLLDLIRRGGDDVKHAIADVILRPDEITELVALYWQNGRRPMSAQMKKGLARAFARFNEYSLAKYDRDGPVKLRDVMRMVHAKPGSDAQSALYKRVVERTLETPDTWEVALSGGADKRETFERLMREGKLGYLAVLRNLRNMVDAKCDRDLIISTILARKGAGMVFPFRYVAAARAVPGLEAAIDRALLASIGEAPVLEGKTAVLVDVSGSMDERLSSKSDLRRIDAAAALASVINARDLRVFSFSDIVVEVPPRRGMAGVDAILKSQPNRATYLGRALRTVAETANYDRIIVITDEQSHDKVPDRVAPRQYMVNVASAKNGVGYGAWTHLDGFSEGVIRWINEFEATGGVE